MNKENVEDTHIIWYNGYVDRWDRNKLNGHQSRLVWFSGLSASGKSTIAHRVEKELLDRSVRAYVLDGDNIRHGLNNNLGFSPAERRENLRRVAEVAKLFVDAGILVLAAFISPFKADREYVRNQFARNDFLEIYVKCSLAECERRDPKGQYQKARAGLINNYTGITSPYEEPENPNLIIDTEELDPKQAVRCVIDLLEKNNYLSVSPQWKDILM
jgi:adenylylsulfate kinase